MRHLLPTLCCVLLLLTGLLPPSSAWAQSGVGYGDWQLHLPSNRAKALADAGSRVYVAAEDAFFYYDKELNTTALLSRRDGLHDVGVQTVAYDSLTRQTLVAYVNGNLDVLQADGSIQNLTDILRKQITGIKAIYGISFNNRMAYLSCSFGLLVLDMARLEVRETYTTIGAGGAAVQVYATTVADGYLLAATSGGVLRGSLAANLLDSRAWAIVLPARAGDPYRTLATQAGTVYAGVNGDQLYRFLPASQTWQAVPGTSASTFNQLTPSAAGLIITDNQKVSVLTAAGQVRPLAAAPVQSPRAALRARDGAYYVADYRNGLVRLAADGQQAESFVNNAPASSLSFGVYSDARSGITDVFSGGYQDRYLQSDLYAGFYEYHDGRWTNITSTTLPDPTQYPNPKDLTHGVRTADGTLYVGSYGQGLLEWKGAGNFRLFNPANGNSPLLSAISNPNYARITDVALDGNGDVWVVNRHQRTNNSGLFVFSPTSNAWRTLPYFSGSENLDRLALDDDNVAWATQARQGGQGLVAYDPATGAVRYFTSATAPDNSTPGLINLYDVVKDRRGAIWVASGSSGEVGVAVFDDPSQAFDPSATFRVPFLRKGESDTGFAILRGQTVLCIATDGANRKWFGTADNGLWLFNADADEALLHFTTDNSPLPSNRINDVSVNDRTGEVFVATDAGLVTYRGSATVTEGKPDCVKVTPNPVRTSFTGEVGISGLVNDAIVKITDVTGALVYQTRANGGTVTWNLLDSNNRRVQSGVYLVLSSDADGKNGCISKIAVVEN
ncbi:T9SS type A sorting domain-containing protein [Hymenobacter profundi]|uniref:T9SS type A sorting domain-containing protein n=1 Tax=Hymenobacter profundi TaxID=1982110 RepID=A0ABS6X017_9BACT|nr:T9SS type A sorting domain-containing protein [Hymenobacter profundi]MBW3129113.1 T9SS type A sorting domain-containing protein [Hymenobacter profundi]